ncbi:MAG: site-specific DNA-methyltransferase [Candidatus Marinimicrobia bacterium]|nr:site-specific DNA-methyltransferase [Candidatus Neomarinimicrobiota bacterium]
MTENKLIKGNCLDYLPEIEKNSIDFIFTDPPYIKALADLYQEWHEQNHDFKVYGDIFSKILKANGQVAIFCDFKTSVAIAKGFQDYFKFRYYYIWQKSNGQPVNKYMPRKNTELILIFKPKKALTSDLTYNPIFSKGKPYVKKHKAGNKTRNSDKSYITKNNGKRYPNQILKYPSKDCMKFNERTDHPTQKPLGLCKYIIKTLSNPGDLILDPFTGSGSLPLAALKLNRQFIAIEKNPKYYKIAKSRITVENNKQSIFNNKPKLNLIQNKE